MLSLARMSHAARHAARHLVALLAFALLASQLALASHHHDEGDAPHGHAGQGCELCVAFPVAAPAPNATSGMALPAAAPPRVPAPSGLPTVAEFDPAHPTRGPPAVHSD